MLSQLLTLRQLLDSGNFVHYFSELTLVCAYWVMWGKRVIYGNQIEPHHEKTCLLEFLTRSDKNRAVQPLKLVRGLKFRIQKVEDFTISYPAADLRLCFHIYGKSRFSNDMAQLAYIHFAISMKV